MICPYCNREMKKGILSGDARHGVHWKEGAKRAGFADNLSGSNTVAAAQCGFLLFTIETHFCPDCKKMIIDTDVTK